MKRELFSLSLIEVIDLLIECSNICMFTWGFFLGFFFGMMFMFLGNLNMPHIYVFLHLSIAR